MATRSDFAQKLLTDLRSRKERMTTPASQNSSTSKGTSRDSHGNLAQHYKGSRQTKSLESASSKPTNSQRRSNQGARSLTMEESMKQLVPYGGGGQNSNQIQDLSKALAFAFGNGKNFTKSNSSSNNPILTFLHRIGIRKMERRNSTSIKKPWSQIINLSNIHINEISKGAQKLNQILKACSNGITFDGYSVEIGRELLKGAMDLEESLRTLANLQEASEQVIDPKRKSRIKLLDENGEEVEDEREIGSLTPQQKLVERPRFSFDKPSRNSQDTKRVNKNDPIRSLMALSIIPYGKQPSSTADVASHKRSDSSSSDFRAENGRLPNVIAKLMGLEDVPQSVNIETTPSRSSSKEKERKILENNVNRNYSSAEKMSKNGGNVVPTASERKVMQNNNLATNLDTFAITKLVPNPSSELRVKTRKNYSEKPKEVIGLEREQTKGVMDQNRRLVEATTTRKETSEGKEIRLEKEKRSVDRKEKLWIEKPRFVKREEQLRKEKNSSSKQKVTLPKFKNEAVEPSTRRSKDLHDEKSYTVRNGRSVNSVPKEIGSATRNSRGSVPLIKEEKPVDIIATERTRNRVIDLKRESPRRKDEHMIKRTVVQEKIGMAFEDQITALEKRRQLRLARSIKGEGTVLSASVSKEAEVLIASPKKSEESSKTLAEHVQPKEEYKVQIASPEKSEVTNTLIERVPLEREAEVPTVSSKRLIEDLPTRKDSEQHPTVNSPKGSELQSLIVPLDLPPIKESSQDMGIEISTDPTDNEDRIARIDEYTCLDLTLESSSGSELQSEIALADLHSTNESSQDNKDLLPCRGEDTCLEAQELEIHSGNGCNEAGMDNPNPPNHEKKEKIIPEHDELLTENELHLKKTLLISQLFLNTAEALFNFSLPVENRHVTDYTSQDHDSKIMLDCSYEIMRRKGKRKELSLYPFQKISTVSVKLTSFDDLVKQLCIDLEKLKVVYEDIDTAESIQEMLETDVENRDTDVNSMWDFGWNDVSFSMMERDELIKEVERFLIYGMIDDIVSEMVC